MARSPAKKRHWARSHDRARGTAVLMGPMVYDADDYERVPKRRTVPQRGHRVKAPYSEETRDRVDPVDRKVSPETPLPTPDPVYRLTLSGTLALLTLDEDERDTLVEAGYLWRVAGYAYPLGTEESGLTPLYRSFHSGVSDHLFTADAVEHAAAVASGYTSEGVGGYVFTTAAPNRIPVYRALRASIHFYSTDRDEIQALGPDWSFEGGQFYLLRSEERSQGGS